MSNPFRPIGIAVSGLIIGLAIVGDAPAQSTGSLVAPLSRRSFAPPGTTKKPERLRFVDVRHIKAELTLDLDKREVRGTVTHTVRPLHPFLEEVELDCGENLNVRRVTLGPNGSACRFQRKGDRLTIQLDKPRGPEDTIELTIAYDGSPDRGIRFILPDPAYPDRPTAIWTQGEAEDTHHWLPCYDYPNDRSTTEMIITVAKPMSVVSNGVLVETKNGPGNTRTYHWKMDAPFVSYLISLAVADFSVYHDKLGNLPIDYYVARGVDEATARRFMGKTPDMVAFFGKAIGRPYPYAKYAQACMPEFGGGMENITATTMTDRPLHDAIAELEENFDGLVAHELAHQWFGDLMTCKDWSHLWLNEGFASYFAPLYREHARGEDEFRIEMHREQRGYLNTDRSYRRPIVESRYASSDEMFDGMSYNKGACVLHMLRGFLGDDAWWKGIRHYVDEHAFDVVETDDFRRSMESATGKDLKWFFDQWVYKAGHPELKIRWRYEDEDGTVRVRVEQTQRVDEQTPLFRLPTTLQIAEDASKMRNIPIVIDGDYQEFVIPASSRPKMVKVDPEGWLIKKVDSSPTDAENLFRLEHGTSVLVRLEAARALSGKTRNHAEIASALSRAWKRESSTSARVRLVELMGNSDKALRTALIEAASDPEARVRVAAINGLGKLPKVEKAEAVLRAAWKNPREAYGARKAALRGLAAWKVPDAPNLLESAVKMPAHRYTIASTALQILLDGPTSRAREMAALYTRYGQPSALRTTALRAFPRLARNDPSLQDLLVKMVDDPNASVRQHALGAVRELKLVRALPVVRARLGRESSGFSARPRRQLQRTIEVLETAEAAARPRSPTDRAASIAELEAQAAELETRARDLRNRITQLKKSGADTGAESRTKDRAPAAGSSR